MKKKTFIIIALVCMVCFLFWWRRPSAERESTNENPVTVLTNTSGITEKMQNRPHALQNAATNKSGALKDPRTMDDNEFQQWSLAQWQAPIDFYGKVIDENSNPVAEAEIQFEWSEKPGHYGAKNSATKSDSQGVFSLLGAKGPSLDVKVSKKGYYTPGPGSEGFSYSGSAHFSPDPLNPVVFHLKKKGEGVPLVQTDFPGFAHIVQLKHDGTPVELNLFEATQVSAGTGQLKLEFWRDISNKKANVFDWKLQLSVENGGLVPTDEEFAFQAPESGYQPSIVIDMPATNQNWQGEVRNKYYIQLPDGKYGRFDLYLLPYNGVFTVHSAINPSGSRNLEPN